MRNLVKKLEDLTKEAKPLPDLLPKKVTDKHQANLSDLMQSQDSSFKSQNINKRDISTLFNKNTQFYRIDDVMKMKTEDGRYNGNDSKDSDFFNKKRKSYTINEDPEKTAEEVKATLRNKHNRYKISEESLLETDRFKDVVKFSKSTYKISSKKGTNKKKSNRRLFDRGMNVETNDINKSKMLRFEQKKLSRDSNKKRKRKGSKDKSKRNISASKSIARRKGMSREGSLIKIKQEKSFFGEDHFNNFLSKLSKSKKRTNSVNKKRHGSAYRGGRIGYTTKVIGNQKFSIISNKKY